MKNQEHKEVLVWDWQTRVLHWLNAFLVIGLAVLALSFEIMEDMGISESTEEYIKRIHAVTGYFFAVTFTLRIIWGFVGNEYARWSDMIPCNRDTRNIIFAYIKWYLSGFKKKPPIVLGHNPLASLFYIPLFIILASQIITGLALAGLEFDYLPVSLFVGNWGEGAKEGLEEIAEEIHEFGLLFVIFFFIAHMAGLVVHTIGEKTGLFFSMIHGKKRLPKDIE